VQVINIVVLGTASGMGGFFTNGLNGVINGTSTSIGSVATLDSASASVNLHHMKVILSILKNYPSNFHWLIHTKRTHGVMCNVSGTL